MSTLTELYACPICGKTFSRKESLAKHIARRHGNMIVILRATTIINRLQEIEHQLKIISREIDRIKCILERLSEEGRIVVQQKKEEAGLKTVDSSLPSFLQDNPWLAVLSKRGR